jgi:hypothetical protein
MDRLHFFEVTGTVLMRQSGRRNPLIECVVIRTRARLQPDGKVQFVELSSGSDTYIVNSWFADWDPEQDNHSMGLDGDDAGRYVFVAVTRTDYEHALKDCTLFTPVIQAVKVGDDWQQAVKTTHLDMMRRLM